MSNEYDYSSICSEITADKVSVVPIRPIDSEVLEEFSWDIEVFSEETGVVVIGNRYEIHCLSIEVSSSVIRKLSSNPVRVPSFAIYDMGEDGEFIHEFFTSFKDALLTVFMLIMEENASRELTELYLSKQM